MKIVAIGGDLRYAYLVRLARLMHIDAGAVGLEKADVDGVQAATWLDVECANCVVMPNPFVNEPVLPYAERTFGCDELVGHLRPGAVLMLFGPKKVPEEIADKFRVVMLSDDECLTMALARQTAEGAIHSAAARMACELADCPIMIVGYGRIGKALHRMLSGYAARIYVAARRASARDEARNNGATALDISQLDAFLPRQRIVFSTPPELVLGAQAIAQMNKSALLVDLSSPPYGADLEAAKARGIVAWREPALPGRYCPESAGKAMFQAVLTAMKGAYHHGR